MKIIALIISFLLALSTSISCVNTNHPASSSSVFTPSTQPLLNKTSWALKFFKDGSIMTPILGNRIISLRFGNNSTYYSGNIGTFYYGGQMSEQGNDLSIGIMTVTPIEIDDDPPGFRQQATNYLALIKNAKTYNIVNGELLVNCGNGSSLIFTPTENPPFNT